MRWCRALSVRSDLLSGSSAVRSSSASIPPGLDSTLGQSMEISESETEFLPRRLQWAGVLLTSCIALRCIAMDANVHRACRDPACRVVSWPLTWWSAGPCLFSRGDFLILARCRRRRRRVDREDNEEALASTEIHARGRVEPGSLLEDGCACIFVFGAARPCALVIPLARLLDCGFNFGSDSGSGFGFGFRSAFFLPSMSVDRVTG